MSDEMHPKCIDMRWPELPAKYYKTSFWQSAMTSKGQVYGHQLCQASDNTCPHGVISIETWASSGGLRLRCLTWDQQSMRFLQSLQKSVKKTHTSQVKKWASIWAIDVARVRNYRVSGKKVYPSPSWIKSAILCVLTSLFAWVYLGKVGIRSVWWNKF